MIWGGELGLGGGSLCLALGVPACLVILTWGRYEGPSLSSSIPLPLPSEGNTDALVPCGLMPTFHASL